MELRSDFTEHLYNIIDCLLFSDIGIEMGVGYIIYTMDEYSVYMEYGEKFAITKIFFCEDTDLEFPTDVVVLIYDLVSRWYRVNPEVCDREYLLLEHQTYSLPSDVSTLFFSDIWIELQSILKDNNISYSMA